jgi:hypothetical protein
MKAALDNYHARMQRVLDHVNQHLDDDLDLEVMSGVAAFSKYHFHRQFTATFGLCIPVLLVPGFQSGKPFLVFRAPLVMRATSPGPRNACLSLRIASGVRKWFGSFPRPSHRFQAGS